MAKRTTSRKKKNRGGRPARPMPDLIPDTPENVARACMQGPPKKHWDYLDAEPTGSGPPQSDTKSS